MNQKEFKNLTGDLLRGLEKKMLEIDGDIDFDQVSNDTFFIYLSDGTVSGRTEVYELKNTGDFAAWKFQGFKK